MEATSTLRNICGAARAEFLAKGFAGASLRRIVKEAGVTTGAFYGYFASKEALFDALVQESAAHFMAEYKKVQRAFKVLPPDEQVASVGKTSGEWLLWIIDYIYDHLDAFKLLLACSEGTKYERFIHELVEIEVQATDDFISVLQGMGQAGVRRIDPQLEHILISGMFSAFFEVVIHDMPKERAKEYTTALLAFQTAGWKAIMGI